MTTRKANPRGHNSPLVEAISKYEGEWEVQDVDNKGVTNNIDRKMWVPLDDDFCRCGKSHGHMIRGHELLHAKMSPESVGPTKVGIRGEVVEVSTANIVIAEEYRINRSLWHIEGSETVRDGFCDLVTNGVAVTMDQGEYAEVVRLALAAPSYHEEVVPVLYAYAQAMKDLAESPPEAGKPDFRAQAAEKAKVAVALAEAIPHYAIVAERIMGGATVGRVLPTWDHVEQLAAFLELNLRDLDQRIADMGHSAPDFDKILPTSRRGAAGELGPKSEKPTKGEGGVWSDDDLDKPVIWGQPDRITTAPLVERIAAWKTQRRNRAVDEGAIPRYMHRWATDKRIFARTKRLPGGSLLVDDSGSMGLSSRGLDEIITAAPAATVAVYAGNDGSDGGEIRVVAKDGKRARREDLSLEDDFGGNGIDGPAIEWLGTQPYPRIWITDGGVTANSGSWEDLKEAARELCIKHKVTVVETASEAAEILRSGRYAR